MKSNRIKARMSKIASFGTEQELKELCVEKILSNNNVKLAEMTVSDLVSYLEMDNELSFENIEELVEDWIRETEENYPEQLL